MNLKHKKYFDFFWGSILILILSPLIMLLGIILKRNHELKVKNNLYFIKMLGGGSLVIALPALLGLRKKYPDIPFIIVTSPQVRQFAWALGIFDRILVIDDRSVTRLLFSSLSALFKCFRADTFIDLEVYSACTAAFSAMSLARNRIGFYTQMVFWKKKINTHLIFFNQFSGAWVFYEEIARLLDSTPSSFDECSSYLYHRLKTEKKPGTDRKIAIGHGCSSLSRERMLDAGQWVNYIKTNITDNITEISFFGMAEDHSMADSIIRELHPIFAGIKLNNFCGKHEFIDSLKILAGCQTYWGIDSALLHFARLFQLECVSFFGPTSPFSLLKPFNELKESVHYKKIPCSPCVHVTLSPPCKGNNICIKNLFDDTAVNHLNLIYYSPD